MVLKIEQDHQRFRGIVKGRIRGDLRKFLQRGELVGKEGRKYVSIPVFDIDIPTFRYGDNSGGVGVGDGEEGDAVGKGKGGAQGGEQPGEHLLEVEISMEELADILGEELQLPRIEPKGRHHLTTVRDRYSGIRSQGPDSLRHFKRTYREALKRQVMLGLYDSANPVVVPIRRDVRYRSWKEIKAPQSNALIVYMMDVSGSMGDEQKDLVRLESFWIDTWLRRNYDGLESRYIVHDVNAHEVDRETFYHVREDGGTRISSAFKCCHEMLERHYDAADWNTYLFHFSDGDNSSDSDNKSCVEILRDQLLPRCNMFGYCQVASAYGTGSFINVLHESFAQTKESVLVTSKVNSKEDIYASLKTFFAAGK